MFGSKDKPQLTQKFFDDSLAEYQNKFKNKFLQSHRNLKSAIHKCQHQAFADQSIDYEKAQEKARQCFLPLLVVRRHGGVIMENAKAEFDACQVKAGEHYEVKTQQDAQLACLGKYKEHLKEQVAFMNSLYEGYLLNFDPASGEVIDLRKFTNS